MDTDHLITYKGEPLDFDTDDCVLWPGSLNNSGYGMKYSRSEAKRAYLAHRWVYEKLYGPIGEGLVIDHLCRVKACVNPAHLQAVTAATNNARAAGVRRANSEARRFCRRGHEAIWFRKGRAEKLMCRLCDRENQARQRARRKAVRANPAI